MKYIAPVLAALACGARALQFQLGNQAYVLYPNATGITSFPDQSTLVLNFTSNLVGYNAIGASRVIINGSSLQSVVANDSTVVTSWDLEAALPLNATFAHGYVHHEHGWYVQSDPASVSRPNGSYFFYGYIMYTHSVDGGRTFDPWPASNNINDTLIITSAGPPNIGGTNNTGTGPHYAVVAAETASGQLVGRPALPGETEYVVLIHQDMYAENSSTGEHAPAFVLARSALADGGLPGTWQKLYRGSWSQPGLQGLASAIPGLSGAKVVWLNESSLWLAVDYNAQLMTAPDLAGPWLTLNTSLYPPPPAGQQHGLYQYSNKWYYPSLIPGYGGTVYYPGDSLWLYYCFYGAGNVSWAYAPRGLAAAQLTLLPPAPANATTIPLSMVLYLGQYFLHTNSSTSGSAAAVGVAVGGAQKDTWATVSPVDQRVYDYGFFLGYTLASPADAGTLPVVPLIDCYLPDDVDHFAARPGECGNLTDVPATAMDSMTTAQQWPPLQYTGNQGTAYLGMMGYLLANNNTAVPGYQLMELWRCYDAANKNHYLEPLYGCAAGDQFPTLLGYLLWQND